MPTKRVDDLKELDYLYHKAMRQAQRPGIRFGPLYRGKDRFVKLWERMPNESKGWVFPVKCRLSSKRKTPYLYVDIATDHDLLWLRKLRPEPKKELKQSGTVTLDLHQLMVGEVLATYVPPGHEIHHVNVNSLDNRASNLVVVPKQLHLDFHSSLRLARQEVLKGAKGSMAPPEGAEGAKAFTLVPGKVYGYLEVVWGSKAASMIKDAVVPTPRHAWVKQALEKAGSMRADRRENTRKILMAIASVAPRRATLGQDIMPQFEPQNKKRRMVENVLEDLVWRRVLLCDGKGHYWPPDLL